MAVTMITAAHVDPTTPVSKAKPRPAVKPAKPHHHGHDHGHHHSPRLPRTYDPDQIHLTSNPREAMQMIIKVTGKPLGYKTPAQEAAYIESLDMGTPVAKYDPEGFMATLGLTGIKGAGRNDDSFVHAVRQTDYKPDTEVGGEPIWVQGKMFDKLLNNRPAFDKVKNSVGVAMDSRANKRKDWTKPLPDKQKLRPTGETPAQRYPNVLKGIPNTAPAPRWHSDFHHGADYGTEAIAKAMGFNSKQAARFATNSDGVDSGKTPYGSTGPHPVGALDRHFNFNRDGQDTRLIFAKKHLERAIEYGRKGAYDEAEIEIGVGLHSLQDLFAHAQSSTSVHATMGGFLDEPKYSPVGMVEATVATRNYMKAYVNGLTSKDGAYNKH